MCLPIIHSFDHGDNMLNEIFQKKCSELISLKHTIQICKATLNRMKSDIKIVYAHKHIIKF